MTPDDVYSALIKVNKSKSSADVKGDVTYVPSGIEKHTTGGNSAAEGRHSQTTAVMRIIRTYTSV